VQTERTVDWEQIKRCFVELHQTARPFLGRALLIGGAACWFYRNQLQQANDPDFKAPQLSVETESKWLSRDIDFTGIFSQDAMELLPKQIVTDAQNRKHVEVAGVRIGFAQVGLTIDPEVALRNARVAGFKHGQETIQFLVADPVTLYFEKQALVQRRGNENDFLHCSLLREYLAYEVVAECEKALQAENELSVSENKRITTFLLSVKSKAPEILSDQRIRKRLAPSLRKDNPAHTLISELLR